MQIRRRPRTRSWTLVIGIVILAIVAGFFALTRARPEVGAFTADGTGPHGLKAMALLYEELGYRVQPSSEPLHALGGGAAILREEGDAEKAPRTGGELAPSNASPTLLVMTQPRAAALSPSDAASLTAWISSGNSALLLGVSDTVTDDVGEASERLGERFGARLEPIADAGERIGRGEETTVALRAAIGQGELVVVTDPAFATNRSIDQDGRAAFLVDIARRAGVRDVWIAEPPDPSAIGASSFGWQGRRGIPSIDEALPLVENAIPALEEALPPIEDGLPPVGSAHVAVAIVVGLWAVGRRLGPRGPRHKHGERRPGPMAAPAYVAETADRYRRAGAGKRRDVLAVQYDALMRALNGQARATSAAGNDSPTAAAASTRPREDAQALATLFAARLPIPEKSLVKTFTRCRAVLDGKAVSERELVKLSKALERCRRSLFKRSEPIE